MLLDELDEAEVTVGERDGVAGVDLVRRVHGLAHQRVEEDGARIALRRLGKVLDLVGAPVEAVVVLVAEKPHQEAGHVLVARDDLSPLREEHLARARVGVVRGRDVRAVDVVAVAAHGVVEDREDAVVLVDVRDPLRRNADVDADRVHAHRLHQRHLVVEGLLDELVGLGPEAVVVVRADREVVPVHAAHEEVLAVDAKGPAARVPVDLNVVRRGALPARRRRHGHDAGGRARRGRDVSRDRGRRSRLRAVRGRVAGRSGRGAIGRRRCRVPRARRGVVVLAGILLDGRKLVGRRVSVGTRRRRGFPRFDGGVVLRRRRLRRRSRRRRIAHVGVLRGRPATEGRRPKQDRQCGEPKSPFTVHTLSSTHRPARHPARRAPLSATNAWRSPSSRPGPGPHSTYRLRHRSRMGSLHGPPIRGPSREYRNSFVR